MQAPAFWWKKPGAAAALLSPFASIYGGVAARRLAQSGQRAGVPAVGVVGPIATARAPETLITLRESPLFRRFDFHAGAGLLDIAPANLVGEIELIVG